MPVSISKYYTGLVIREFRMMWVLRRYAYAGRVGIYKRFRIPIWQNVQGSEFNSRYKPFPSVVVDDNHPRNGATREKQTRLSRKLSRPKGNRDAGYRCLAAVYKETASTPGIRGIVYIVRAA